MDRAERVAVNFRAVRQLTRLLRQHHFDIIHVHGGIGGMLGRVAAAAAHAPVVVYTPNAWPFLATGHRFWAKAHLWFERWAARCTAAIVCVSNCERQMAQRYRIAPSEKLTVIPNGIDSNRVRGNRELARRALNLRPDAIVIGTVTRLSYQKDPLGLIAAATPVLKINPRRRLVVIGDGPLRAAVERACAAARISPQVTFAGFRPDATELQFSFDVFVMSSRYEGLSYALLDAMAAGLAVIATGGGSQDIIKNNENGLVVPPGDTTALQQALERLTNDPDLRQRFGTRGQAAVSEFTASAMVRKTETLYRMLLNKPPV